MVLHFARIGYRPEERRRDLWETREMCDDQGILPGFTTTLSEINLIIIEIFRSGLFLSSAEKNKESHCTLWEI